MNTDLIERLKHFIKEADYHAEEVIKCKANNCNKVLRPFEIIQGEYCAKHAREINQKFLHDESNRF